MASYHCVFAIVPLHLSKVLRLPRKSDASSYEVLHLSRKITLANLKIWCSKMQPLSGNQRPDLLTSLVSCAAPATRHASLQILFKCLTLAIVFGNAPKSSRFAHFWQGAEPLAPATQHHASTSKRGVNMWFIFRFEFGMCFAPQCRALFQHLNFQKWSDTWGVLYILASKGALRHNDVHFFHVTTSKSSPRLRCFVHFDLEMCFAPQRRAIVHLSSGQLAPHPPL